MEQNSKQQVNIPGLDGDSSESTHDHQLLVFQLNNELFACDLLEISEVIEPVELKRVPRTSETFLGVFNLRGEIIGAIDIRKKMNAENTPESIAYIIADVEGGKVALIIDRCVSVKGIGIEEIQRSEVLRKDISGRYVVGYYYNEKEEIVTILGIQKLLEEFNIDPKDVSKLAA